MFSSLHHDSIYAAGLARKINNREALSWQEAQDFKFRVTSKMADIQKYLTSESAILAQKSTTYDPTQGWNNEFQDRLNEINKLQASIAGKKDIISNLATATEHEREATRKLAQEGLAQFTGVAISGSASNSILPVWSTATGIRQGENTNIAPDSRAAGLQQAAKLKTSAPNDIEFNATAYNGDFKIKHSTEFATILTTLKKDPKHAAISTALSTYLTNDGTTYTNALVLQKAILDSLGSAATFSTTDSKAKGGPDGFFGPISLAALQKVVGIAVTPDVTPVSGATPGAAPRTTPATSTEPATQIPAQVTSAPAAAVSPLDTSTLPVLSSAPTNTSYGLSLQNGRVWVLGAKWERHELKTAMLPELGQVDSAKFQSAVSFVQDAGLLLESMAAYAVSHNWKGKEEYAKRVIAYGDFIAKLTETDPAKVKILVTKYVDGVISPTSQVGGDIRRLWLMDTSMADTDRSARVISYVRKDLEAYEKVGQMRAAEILADKNIALTSFQSFATYLTAQNLASLTPGQIMVKIKAIDPALEVFMLKAFPGAAFQVFVTDLKKSYETLESGLEKARKEGQFKKLDGTGMSSAEIDTKKAELRNQSLSRLIQSSVLESYAKNNTNEYATNPALKEFADIQWVGTLKLSDKTMVYIKNELWKDIAIEWAAIGIGAITGGAGYVGVRMVSAALWAKRAGQARSAYKMGNIGAIAANTLGQGIGFELWHAGVRSYTSGENKFSTAGFMQSMAFSGAFHAVGAIMASKNIDVVIDFALPLHTQKAILGKIVTADAMVALGISYGISWHQGTDYTWEEALQAIALAAFMRWGMTVGEKLAIKKINWSLTVTPTHTNPVDIIGAPRLAELSTKTPASIKGQMTRLQNQIISEQNLVMPTQKINSSQFDAFIIKYQDAFYDPTKYMDDIAASITNKTIKARAVNAFEWSIPDKITKYYELLFEFERRGLHGVNPSRMRGGTPAVVPAAALAAPAPAPWVAPALAAGATSLTDSLYADIANTLWKTISKSNTPKTVAGFEITYDTVTKKIITKEVANPTNQKLHDTPKDLKTFLASLGKDEEIFLTMQTTAPALKFVNAFKIGADKFLAHTDGSIYKNWAKMTPSEITILINDKAAAEKLFAAVYDSQSFKQAMESVFTKMWSGAKSAGWAVLDIATKPWVADGFTAIPAAVWNTLRLPLVNGRIITETVMNSTALKTKVWDITKTLLIANKNGFDGKMNTLITIVSTIAIGVFVADHMKALKASGKLPEEMTIADTCYEWAKNYLATVNIYMPPEMWRQLFDIKR